ncbi:hypothetical protein B0T18DRAFT_417173 [Schizothecium vesticola]|uniref:Uncharacterized protein n=1 Tax=Schizothecium vesticola TaxID=314040 RepID=A0AA40BTH7_9PEZI|nr:hypothetical protein B0T18DRAFT_417173 [Schizothecium vesticola]
MKSIANILLISVLLPLLGSVSATPAASDLLGTEHIDYPEPRGYVTLNGTELEHDLEARTHNNPALEYRYYSGATCSGTTRTNRVRDGICYDLETGSARIIRFYGDCHTVRQHTGRGCTGNRRDTSSTSTCMTFAGLYKSFQVYCRT